MDFELQRLVEEQLPDELKSFYMNYNLAMRELGIQVEPVELTFTQSQNQRNLPIFSGN